MDQIRSPSFEVLESILDLDSFFAGQVVGVDATILILCPIPDGLWVQMTRPGRYFFGLKPFET
jgi:hypothetical protein